MLNKLFLKSLEVLSIIIYLLEVWSFCSLVRCLSIVIPKVCNMSTQETVHPSIRENVTEAIKKVIVMNCAVNIPLALTSIIGNTLVLHAVWKTPALRSPSMFLLCGLALSDLAVGAIVQPLFITDNLIRLYSQSQHLKHSFLNVYNIFGFFLCGISLCTVTAISVDRLIAVHKSLLYPSIVTISRVRWLLVSIWAACAVIASSHFWQQMAQLVGIAALICFCLCTSAYSHVKIFKVVRRHQNAIHIQVQAIETNTRNVNNMAVLKNSAFNAFLVFLVLVICYSPYFIIYVVTSVNPINIFLSRSLTSTIVFINSSLNPFLYCWRLSKIREVVKQTCHELVCCK